MKNHLKTKHFPEFNALYLEEPSSSSQSLDDFFMSKAVKKLPASSDLAKKCLTRL